MNKLVVQYQRNYKILRLGTVCLSHGVTGARARATRTCGKVSRGVGLPSQKNVIWKWLAYEIALVHT